MQASWIDSDELRALAAALQEPVAEIHEELWIAEPLLDDTFTPAIAPAAASFVPAAPTPVAPVCEPTTELQALHVQLNVIREQARAAGLLPVVQEEPPAAVEVTPMAPEPIIHHQDSPVQEETAAPPIPVASQPSPVVSEPAITAPSFSQSPELTQMSQRLSHLQRFVTELTACKDLLLMNQEGDLLWGSSQHYDVMATIMIAMRYHNPTAFEATHFKLTNLDDTLVVLSMPTRHGQVFLALINAVNTDDNKLQQLSHAVISAIEGATVY